MGEDGSLRFARLLAGEDLPAALVDLDALEANVETIGAALGDRCTLRVASKSLRHPWLLRHVLEHGGERFRGVLAYAAREAAFLAGHGFDDLLVAYPLARASEARVLAQLAATGCRVAQVVDDPAHLALLAEAARAAGARIRVVLDVDVSWRPLGGAVHLGVRRSPIRGGEAAVALAEEARGTGVLEVDGVLAYEAQIAGVADVNPSSRALDPVRRLIKARSRELVRSRRAEVVDLLRQAGHPVALVNGGGTGSVGWTAEDPAVTEVSAGSGFLCPHLFDGYAGLSLRPALFFGLSVVRRSDPDHVTCAGGGYVASGAPGPDRLPVVHWPPGLVPVALEGFGEVQTPLRVVRGDPPAIGAPVVLRPAKSGELAERFDSYLLVRGDRVVGREPTARGLGGDFG